MSLIILIASFLGLGTLVASLLSQVALWQQKEYRWDRMWSHLKSPQGSLLNHPFVLLAMVALLKAWLNYVFPVSEFALNVILGWIALVLFSLHHAARIKQRGVIRPDFTIRALATLTIAAVFSLYLFSLALSFPSLAALLWATGILLAPGAVGVAVHLVGLPFQLKKKQIIARAKRLRSARTRVAVVGITGSYGKTSTKHFLEQILKSAGKNVAATEAHHNTPVGVAQDLLKQLQPSLEIYIAELGAYRRGEIKELAEIAQPNLGVVTAIGNQHLDLFGSQENILKGKCGGR